MCLKILIALTCSFAVVKSQVVVPNPIYLRTPETGCADIKFIVDYHNQLRESLASGSLKSQPKALNMQKLAWDQELAEVASNYSKKMIFAHNAQRSHSRWGGNVGENIFMTATANLRSTNIEWKKAIDAWFDEHKKYVFGMVTGNPATSHYTQVVWASTTYIGCATTHFTDVRRRLYKIYVCNYGPTGNWLHEEPYNPDYGFADEEFAFLVELGILSPDQLPKENNELICGDQCNMLYGPACTPKKN